MVLKQTQKELSDLQPVGDDLFHWQTTCLLQWVDYTT
uniref:Uncharacterized protein n=1 Tax=Melopsittacus undulatus TaxID=13146 RepID=A0A8V5GRY5_MELUD